MPNLAIFYPNGEVEAVQLFVWDGSKPVLWDGEVTVGAITVDDVTIADGGDATQGSKADAKSTATDATPISIVSILKQISASVQTPPSHAVTGPLTDTQLRASAVPISLATAPTTPITNADITSLLATAGATSGAKVITDANGTLQQYLRGLIYQSITPAASFVTPTPDTVNGWLVAQMTSADGSTALTNSAQVIKASAGKLGGWYIYNPNSTATYIPIYNVAAASVTVGTTNPQLTLCIPATSAANLEMVMGIPFSNAGFSCAAATTAGGNSAPSIALEANFFYK